MKIKDNMKNRDVKLTQIKNSILMVIGMAFMLIGTNDVPSYVKYTALIISLAALLYMLFGFAKDAVNQVSSVKKDKTNQ